MEEKQYKLETLALHAGQEVPDGAHEDHLGAHVFVDALEAVQAALAFQQ